VAALATVGQELGEHMVIIGWLLVGLLAGALARLLMPGRDPLGCFGTALLGVVGSFVGGFLYELIAYHKATLHRSGLIGSVVGAMLVLLLRRLMVRESR
jgi:uncharacterized membrane protein YeaQ/YmgE (transglycosylase-associated protein family)